VRREFRAVLMAGAALLAGMPSAIAQSYPTRPITMIVGFPAGGSTDAIGRILQEPMSRSLGQQIVIDNRPGAAGTTAGAAVANAAPDGYTLLLTVNAALTMNRYLQKNFPFDSRKAFAPITLTSDLVLALAVNAELPVKTVPELIEYAKKNPGKLSYGSAGIGSGHHIVGEMLKQKTGIDMVHVPYRGGALAIQDLVAGNIGVSFGSPPALLPHVQSGKIRMVAMAERKRHPDFPDLPTLEEFVPGVFNIGWSGILAPAGTPQAAIEKVHSAATDALKMPDVVAKMKLQGLVARSSNPAELGKMVSDEIDFWAKVIPSIGIQPE
jgi:tripartite-type tricarboxylate transporter receptor subunit TctC